MRYTQYDTETETYKPTVYVLGYVDDDEYYIYLYGNDDSVQEEVVNRLTQVGQ